LRREPKENRSFLSKGVLSYVERKNGRRQKSIYFYYQQSFMLIFIAKHIFQTDKKRRRFNAVQSIYAF